MRKHHMDFVVNDFPSRPTIFRFYPRQTHVHGFEDEAPTDWKGVYKVYYSWAIITKQYDLESNELEYVETLFDMRCDECSMIPNLEGAIDHLDKTGIPVYLQAFGQPAGDWEIEKRSYKDPINNKKQTYYTFKVFDNYSGQGFKFVLYKKEVEKFKKYLHDINEYALVHSEGI